MCSLHEHLRIHKVFTKDQCFLSYHKISIKLYVVDVYFYHFDSDPIFLPFLLMLGANLGSLLYGDVSVMCNKLLGN